MPRPPNPPSTPITPPKAIDGVPGGSYTPHRVVMTADGDCPDCKGTGRYQKRPFHPSPICYCVEGRPG